MRSRATGEIELEDGTLVIKRIHVTYELKADPDADRDEIDRVLDFHADSCPVAKSISGSIDVSTSVEVTGA